MAGDRGKLPQYIYTSVSLRESLVAFAPRDELHRVESWSRRKVKPRTVAYSTQAFKIPALFKALHRAYVVLQGLQYNDLRLQYPRILTPFTRCAAPITFCLAGLYYCAELHWSPRFTLRVHTRHFRLFRLS